MSDAKGFLKYDRLTPKYREVAERVLDYNDVVNEKSLTPTQTNEQAARCMGCGVPFCQSGCPLGNQIPEFNDAVHQGNWKMAYQLLVETNNFPEFTGRICPAPCEHACVLGINQAPVSIEHIEKTIIETAFEQGWVTPKIPLARTGKSVAIIGSGPAGLAAAMQLNREGHSVTVFEKDEKPGGLLRFGIPDFKLEKWLIDRRISLLKAEGIDFQCNTNIGIDVTGQDLLDKYDAILVCAGALASREVAVPGRSFHGIFPAMDYLSKNNRCVADPNIEPNPLMLAHGKHVVVIGGGDTGSDCVGTVNRQFAASVTQLQYRFKPAEQRNEENPWPHYPMTLTTSSSHEEGCERGWAVQTKGFTANLHGKVKGLVVSDLHWEKDTNTGKYGFQEIAGSEREIPCDLALIAIGFQGVTPAPIWEQLGVALNEKGVIDAHNYQTKNPKVFVAGDARRGQSLVVWAIAEGREAAKAMVFSSSVEPPSTQRRLVLKN
jgi:glutamate synthase (NADPH) small chain